MTRPALITLKDVSYSYGSVKAIEEINIEITQGEIHALIGEHGAGKSSLAHILSGFIQPKGCLYWKGSDLGVYNSKIARNLGISYVTQGTELFDYQSVAMNLFNNNPGVFSRFFFNTAKINKRAEEYLERIGSDINPRSLVGELSKPQRVFVDILRHIYRNPKLLILDEAIEKLTAVDLSRVMKIIRELRNNGSTIVFITHRIDDVYEFADRVTILRKGRIIVTEAVENIDKINLIKLAYTQITQSKSMMNVDKEFYHLLKYNEAILEFLPIALFVVNREEKIKLINTYGENFFGRKKEELLNEDFNKILGPENNVLLEKIRSLLKKRKWENLYQVQVKIEQKIICGNIVVYPIHDGNYYMGSIIIIDDMTEQEELRKKIQLSEKLASVGLLAAGVAHEINNPLEIINNYLDVLKGLQSSDEAVSFIRYMEEEMDSIEMIIGNLITFSEKNQYEDEELNLPDLLSQMLKLVQFNAQKRNISISADFPEEAIRIKANKTKIKQVILNIIRNAFDSMTEGGTLTATIRTTGTDSVIIEFTDTGTGLHEKDINSVMLPFFTTKDGNEENMGLGLSIVYGILKSYNGMLEIKNRQDRRGCIVRISLPMLSARNS
ncbi:MAG: ATP-binding cassette domain-containing protein [Spirochaetales bacterium]|nr:ATP-binding cassette domain-containing protein [Spirochaetales bacterium]